MTRHTRLQATIIRRRSLPTGRASTSFTQMTINSLTTDSSKLRHLITRRSPTTETQQPIDRKWSVKPILRSIQIYAGIALRFDRKSDLRRAMKPGLIARRNAMLE